MWLELTLTIVLALVVSAVALLVRTMWLRARGEEPFPEEQHVTGAGFFTYGALVVSLLVGVFSPVVAPESQLGHWIRHEGGLPTYIVICGVWHMVLAGILSTLGYSPMRLKK